MRYYCYDACDDYGGQIVTVSEEDIRRDYYPKWYDSMCKEFGKEKVDELCNFEDCLKDWVIDNWAWENKPKAEEQE